MIDHTNVGKRSSKKEEKGNNSHKGKSLSVILIFDNYIFTNACLELVWIIQKGDLLPFYLNY